MLKRLYLPAIIAILLSLVLAACGGDDETPTPTATPTDTPTPTVETPPGVTRIEVTNQDMGGTGEYKFVPNEFKFSKGETVEFTIAAETEFHTFTVDELGIDQALESGQPVTFTFTFDKPGTYRLFCIPHEAFGMVGTITVTE